MLYILLYVFISAYIINMIALWTGYNAWTLASGISWLVMIVLWTLYIAKYGVGDGDKN